MSLFVIWLKGSHRSSSSASSPRGSHCAPGMWWCPSQSKYKLPFGLSSAAFLGGSSNSWDFPSQIEGRHCPSWDLSLEPSPGAPVLLPSTRSPFCLRAAENVQKVARNSSSRNPHIISLQVKRILLEPLSLLSTYYVPSALLPTEIMGVDDVYPAIFNKGLVFVYFLCPTTELPVSHALYHLIFVSVLCDKNYYYFCYENSELQSG